MQPAKHSVLRRNVRDVCDGNCLSVDKSVAVVTDLVAATRYYKIIPRSLPAWYQDFNDSHSQDIPNSEHLSEGNLN